MKIHPPTELQRSPNELLEIARAWDIFGFVCLLVFLYFAYHLV